jgi:hypothetical protein
MKLYLNALSLEVEQLFGVEQSLTIIALMIELPYVTVYLISLDTTLVIPVETVDKQLAVLFQ